MAAPQQSGRERQRRRWHRITRALLAGLVTASAMFFLVAVVQTPGLDPPPESVALFIAITAAGVVSYRLLGEGERLGYPATILTGALILVVLVLVASGTYGSTGSRTNPVGPISYLVLTLMTVGSAALAWRQDGPEDARSTASSPT